MQAIWFFLVLGIAAYVFLVREKYAPKERLGHEEVDLRWWRWHRPR